jgi:plasmid stabilization system protein ParE
MIPLRWAPGAVADLARLRSFLGNESPAAAARAARRIREAAALLRAQPELGHAVDGEVFRDLLAPFGGGAYVLATGSMTTSSSSSGSGTGERSGAKEDAA